MIASLFDELTAGINLWLLAAAAMLLPLIPAAIVAFRGPPGDRLVGLEFATPLIVLFLVLLCEGFQHPSFYDVPLTLALLNFGSGMVFARFLQRWQ